MEKTTTKAPAPSRIVYETPHFRVVVGLLSGPAETPEELRLKYLIGERASGVIYGTAAHIGQAKVAAIQAEQELTLANAIVQESEARGFAPNSSDDEPPAKFS